MSISSRVQNFTEHAHVCTFIKTRIYWLTPPFNINAKLIHLWINKFIVGNQAKNTNKLHKKLFLSH